MLTVENHNVVSKRYCRSTFTKLYYSPPELNDNVHLTAKYGQYTRKERIINTLFVTATMLCITKYRINHYP